MGRGRGRSWFTVITQKSHNLSRGEAETVPWDKSWEAGYDLGAATEKEDVGFLFSFFFF